ncbi:MAG TPA: RNA polymerase sigma factor [Pirellulales bacterium]|jgi:RNA polymerase sigma-70 factor (ECF subfamily)|nr:RNA polymerase sigma factor [Pirellulales bacterium]
MFRMHPDELLLDQLKQRVPAAYAIFVDRFETPLYRFFLSDHRDHHLAQEQTAETFAQLVRTLPTMRGSYGQLRAFVFATARHIQLRRWRQPKQRPVPLAEAIHVNDPGPSPAALAAAREQMERALGAISRLDQAPRNVLLLRFVEECSIEEIAEILEMPVGTVKSHIHRGRSQLQAILAEQECKP